MTEKFISKLQDEMERGVHDYTKGGKCSECGRCCSTLLPMSKNEERVIRKYIKKHHIEPVKRVLPTRRDCIDLVCPFLDFGANEKKCLIYPVRPKICKVFQCNQPPSTIRINKENFNQTRQIYNMNDLFE